MLVYGLTHPQFSPCALLEGHADRGSWYATTLGYGPWDEELEHIRVTTSRPLPGQAATDTVPAGFESARLEPAEVHIDGATVHGLIRRHADTWLLTAEASGYKITVSGRGPAGDTTLHQISDITPAIDARGSYLETRRRDRSTPPE